MERKDNPFGRTYVCPCEWNNYNPFSIIIVQNIYIYSDVERGQQ